jgi:hypothetical protein
MDRTLDYLKTRVLENGGVIPPGGSGQVDAFVAGEEFLEESAANAQRAGAGNSLNGGILKSNKRLRLLNSLRAKNKTDLSVGEVLAVISQSQVDGVFAEISRASNWSVLVVQFLGNQLLLSLE